MESAALEDLLTQSMRRDTCSRPRKIRKADGTEVYVRCQSKKASQCVACAMLFATDQKRLIGSGCNESERDGITAEMLSEFDFYFVTLTAPSFGGTHRVPKSKDSKAVECRCGTVHEYGSELRGTPTGTSYRYSAQTRWNQATSELFRRTIRYTTELLPDLEFSFSREWQVRGALHFHGIIRVPASYDEGMTWSALQQMRTYSYGEFAWGKEMDVQRIAGDSAVGSVRYMSKVVAYTAKQQGDVGVISEVRQAHYGLLDKHAARLICSSRGCKGDGTCMGLAHRSFGYAGQLITRSKGWSLAGLTRSTLMEERRQFAEQNSNNKAHQSALDVLAKAWVSDIRADVRIWDAGREGDVDAMADDFFASDREPLLVE
jgi:hypothetical protein